jgi:hypothetical protein
MREFINAKGERVRLVPTDVPYKYRVEIDGAAYNPTERIIHNGRG